MIEPNEDQLAFVPLDPLHGQCFTVRKRDGRKDEFNEARIYLAIESAFKAVAGVGRDQPLPDVLQTAVKKTADAVVELVLSRAVKGEVLEVEKIQDAVEDQLMRDGHSTVARCYILYREERRKARAARENRPVLPPPPIQNRADDFSYYINEGIYLDLLSPSLLDFDLDLLAAKLCPDRDQPFSAGGLHFLRKNFLLYEKERPIETPQFFWMRLAAGLALNEGGQNDARALEFYEALSTFRFVPSTPILLNAGTPHPCLSSCYSATSWNDLEHVTALPGGRMKQNAPDSTCSWLEPWHIGIGDFLNRAQPGQPRWKHDLNKGLWICDLFMKRVQERGHWTLFNPAEAPGLHQLYGSRFEERYLEYEQKAARGEIKSSKRVEAFQLWHEILASLSQTGQPWIAFKDAVNIRSPQTHAGTVQSANLCDLLLNTSEREAAACPLGAINLAAHIKDNTLDLPLLGCTVGAAVRMLDNAIDISAYPTPAARASSQQHRPIGLGLIGFQDASDQLGIHYASPEAAEFADRSMEAVSYYAIMASISLANERGAYPSFNGSKWSLGLLPGDTLNLLDASRGTPLDLDRSSAQRWPVLREMIRRQGIRNSNITAITSDVAGASIVGVHSSIQPATEIEPAWLIECAARRQKWIDMGQTLTLHTTDSDPARLSEIYMLAWQKGLKTTYELRSGIPATAKSDEAPSACSLSSKVG